MTTINYEAEVRKVNINAFCFWNSMFYRVYFPNRKSKQESIGNGGITKDLAWKSAYEYLLSQSKIKG